MSFPEHLTSKPRPPISRKPPTSNGAPSTPSQLGERGSKARNSGAKVKSIVSKFSHPETPPTTSGDATLTTDPPLRTRRPRRAPTVKPKPTRPSVQQSGGPDQAPPLPMNRSRILPQAKMETPGGEEGNGIPVSRSAPDGKEVELQLIGEVKAEAENGSDTPLNPCCDWDCSCVCHVHMPGMKLVWVPIDEEEEEEEEEIELEAETEEEERGGEGESKAGDEEEGSGLSSEQGAEQILKKAKLNQVQDVMISKGNQRRSDPGSQVILTSLALKCPQSPPIPPKQTQSPPSHFKASIEEEEESIYEDTLLMAEPTPRKICQELDIPLIKVQKPVHWSKLSSSNSEDNTSIHPSQTQTNEDAPLAIPPQLALAQDKSKTPGHNLMPVHRGGIALPQPTAEEWRSLRPSPANPSTSPIVLHGAGYRVPPPQLPKTGISVHSVKQAIKVPLYQTYRATVIHKEIRRQTVCRNTSKTSADLHMDWTARRGGVGMGSGGVGAVGMGNGAASATIPLPTPGQSTLWQDLQEVRDSGVLETLSPAHCKYQESMFEVLTSEASYLRSLRVLKEHFLESRELEEVLIIRDRKTLFSNVLRVLGVSESFLKDLENRMEESLVFSDICDIIHFHAQHNFPVYIDYESPQCQRLPFTSFLLLPFQRITRIKILIENILKRTNEGTEEEQTASKALDSVSKIIEECSTEVGKMKQRFVVLDHAHRSLVQVQPIGDDQASSPSYEHCFCLTLLENHQGRMMERLMKAPSQSDLHRWIAAFPNPSKPDGDKEEVIYDDWDCPQVQCVEQYVAQQADELTLEPSEIINVVRKTNEGWYEGIRLSNGQKGWFPMENAIEITNEYVRRRNLRERYRVIQAASIVTNNKAKTTP
ncbi:unnamed protein product [Coregonus sp. 'balchen']|nr:unnamed protein product [Coregonus sp. 'balchen']